VSTRQLFLWKKKDQSSYQNTIACSLAIFDLKKKKDQNKPNNR
jgi:hypothetical protein